MGSRPGKLANIGGTVASLDMRTARPAPKTADRFYTSPDWRSLVADLIKRRGRRCERCGKTQEQDGSPVRLIGDHKRERRDGGADLDPRNVELLCSRLGGNGKPHSDGKVGGCHARKTAEAARERLMG